LPNGLPSALAVGERGYQLSEAGTFACDCGTHSESGFGKMSDHAENEDDTTYSRASDKAGDAQLTVNTKDDADDNVDGDKEFADEN
jgi:hypothetical protein